MQINLENNFSSFTIKTNFKYTKLLYFFKIMRINKRIIITPSNIHNLSPFLRKNIDVLKYDNDLKDNLRKILN